MNFFFLLIIGPFSLNSHDNGLSKASRYKVDHSENEESYKHNPIQNNKLNSFSLGSKLNENKPSHISSKYIHYVTTSRIENLLKLTKKTSNKRSLDDLDFETRVSLDEIKLKVSFIES